MNETPNNNQSNEETIATEEMQGTATTLSLVLSALLFCIASTAVPLSFIKPWVSVGLWFAMIAGCIVMFRRFRVGVTLTVVASFVVLIFSGRYIFAGVLVTAFAVGIFSGTYFMTAMKKPYWALLIPLVAVAVTLIFTRNWLYLLSALSLLPAVSLLAYATRHGVGRTVGICYAGAGLLFSALLLFCLYLALTERGLSVESFKNLLETWKTSLLAERKEMRDELLAMLEKTYANGAFADNEQITSSLEYYRKLLSDAVLESDLNSTFNLLPAIATVLALVSAYIGQLLLLEGYESCGLRSRIVPENEFFVMSVLSAVLWLVCFAVPLFAGSSTATVFLVMDNLCLILTAGFSVVGIYNFLHFLKVAPPQVRWLPIAVLSALVCCASSSVFYILSAFGAYATVRSAIARMSDRNRFE